MVYGCWIFRFQACALSSWTRFSKVIWVTLNPVIRTHRHPMIVMDGSSFEAWGSETPLLIVCVALGLGASGVLRSGSAARYDAVRALLFSGFRVWPSGPGGFRIQVPLPGAATAFFPLLKVPGFLKTSLY